MVYSHPNFVRVRPTADVSRPAPTEAMVIGPDGRRLPAGEMLEKGAKGYATVRPFSIAAPPVGALPPDTPPLTPVTRQTLVTEGFEGAFPGSWTLWDGSIGSPVWDDETYRDYSGSRSGYAVGSSVAPPGPYPPNSNSWMYRSVNLSNAEDAHVQLKTWVRTEADFDYILVAATPDIGLSFWGYIWSGDWATASGGDGWMTIDLDLGNVPTYGSLLGDSEVWIAIIFQSEGSVQDEGVYVDDIVIEQITGGYQSLTNDVLDHFQWSLNNNEQTWGVDGSDIKADEGWGVSSPISTTIAVLDEGVDLTHPDLTGKLVPGYDATGQGSNGGPQGNDAHGTGCAGIAAAITNNSEGVAGIARDAAIMPIRIAYSNTSGDWVTTDGWIANSINFAVSNGADVLSNSWGGGSPSTAINNAINNATTNGRGGLGCPVLFATGNNNGPVSYPASLDSVIAVGATSPCDERTSPTSCDAEFWWGSNYGPEIDIVAPGVLMPTTDISGAAGYTSGDYTLFNGTSSATPVAAGVAAQMLANSPALTWSQVRDILQQSADDLGSPGWDSQTGHGRVNLFAALDQLPEPCYTLTRGHTGSGSDPTASPTNSTGCASGSYQPGESISLTANPATGWKVQSWWGTSNNGSTSTSNSVTMPASDHSVGVNYVELFELSVSLLGTGSGNVTSAPIGIDCGNGGSVCNFDFPPNTEVVLTGTPAIGSELTSWTGDGDCTDGMLTMSGARSCIATFSPCSGDSEATLSNDQITSDVIHSPCNNGHYGPNLQVTGTGSLEVRVGNSATFYDGFEILIDGELVVILGQPMP